jgi:sporulation protein YlmC with PRC-barrel domain
MRLKKLRGLPVIDPTAARRMGLISDYQVDPASGRLAAVHITTVDTEASVRISADRIRRVGQHAVVLTSRGAASGGAASSPNGNELDAAALSGLEVIGDDGNRIGRMLDATFNQDSLAIEAYLLRPEGWRLLIGRGRRIQPSQVHACSRDLMIVTSGRVAAIEAGEPGTADEPDASDASLSLKPADRAPSPSVVSEVSDAKPVPAQIS